MSVEITPAQLLLVVFNLLLLCLAFFIRQWINRVQSDLSSVKKSIEKQQEDFHAYQLQCANEYAHKTDLNTGRSEMIEAMHKIESKVDRIFDKLDTKADKP